MSDEERDRGPGAPESESKEPSPPDEKPPWLLDPTTPSWEESGEDPLARALTEQFPGAIESARTYAGDLTLKIRRESIAEISACLKQRHGFTYLVDVCGADYPKRDLRFEIVYHLYNFDSNRRIRLKVATDEGTPVPSVSGIWRAANWSEREAYDMFGVRFANHPDMTRILLWEGFNGYPLRKDFPLQGVDTGAAIYPEYYDEADGPVSGTGTGWKPPEPPKEEEPQES